MAFHPLRTFQKNRKFWMASILLVCMVTFVLCTGLQGGDFGTWLLELFGRSRGPLVVTIGGKSYYQRDIDDIKTSATSPTNTCAPPASSPSSGCA